MDHLNLWKSEIFNGFYSVAASNIFSIFFSVLLALGCQYFGNLVLCRLKIEADLVKIFDFIFGAGVISGILSWGLVSRQFNSEFCGYIAIALILMGVAEAIKILTTLNKATYTTEWAFNKLLWILIFLIAILPITDADVLDYHLGVAKEMLNTNSYVFAPYWFHSRLAGNGEALIALGLSVNALQFGPLLQLGGLFTIAKILWNIKKNYLVQAAVITAPVVVTWSISAKPILLPVAFIVSATYCFLKIRISSEGNKNEVNIFILAIFYLLVAFTFRVSYITTIFIVIGYGIYTLYRKKYLSKIEKSDLILITLIIIFIVSPQYIWKYYNYSSNIIELIINPFPGKWPGYDAFIVNLRSYKDSTYIFPLFLLLPDKLGNIGTVFGVGLLLIIFKLTGNKKNIIVNELLTISIIDIVLVHLFIQDSSRFFIQSYIIFMIALLQLKSNFDGRILKILIILQEILFIIISCIYLYKMLPSLINKENADQALKKYAYGYSEISWVNSILPADSIIISEPRSISLYKMKAIANDWNSYVSNEKDKTIYKEYISKLKPEYKVIITESDDPRNLDRGYKIIAGPFTSKMATRNPYNSNKKYHVWIIKLNYDK